MTRRGRLPHAPRLHASSHRTDANTVNVTEPLFCGGRKSVSKGKRSCTVGLTGGRLHPPPRSSAPAVRSPGIRGWRSGLGTAGGAWARSPHRALSCHWLRLPPAVPGAPTGRGGQARHGLHASAEAGARCSRPWPVRGLPRVRVTPDTSASAPGARGVCRGCAGGSGVGAEEGRMVTSREEQPCPTSWMGARSRNPREMGREVTWSYSPRGRGDHAAPAGNREALNLRGGQGRLQGWPWRGVGDSHLKKSGELVQAEGAAEPKAPSPGALRTPGERRGHRKAR